MPQIPVNLIDFKGTYPYATEPFGVYQPLLGWKGRQAVTRVNRVRQRNLASLVARMRDDPRLWQNADIPQVAQPPLPGPDYPPTGLASAVAVRVAAAGREIESASGLPVTDADLRSLLRVDRLSKVLQAVVGDPATQARIDAAENARNAAMANNPYISQGSVAADPRQSVLGHEAAVASALAWLGQSSLDTARGVLFGRANAFVLAQAFIDPIAAYLSGLVSVVLSPVGLVQLYREYFFELDTFLGPPVGHVWVSPGGTLEVMEVNTRKTTVERATEASTSTAQTSESASTQQDDLADAVKDANSQNTKLGATASASYSMGKVFQAQASATFGLDTTRSNSDEITHKQMRSQSEKLTSEIRQNFKTTFRTVTETTDTSSRRYVLANTTAALVNYELRRKMRRVAVQVQHTGTQLCWQVYLDNTGDTLGVASLIHVAKPEDSGSVPAPPDAPAQLDPKDTTWDIDFAFQPIGDPGDTDDDYFNGSEDPTWGTTKSIVWEADYTLTPPASNYTLAAVTLQGVHGQGSSAAAHVTFQPNVPVQNGFHLQLPYVNFGDGSSIHITAGAHWNPPDMTAANTQYQAKYAQYTEQIRQDTQTAYVALVRDRIEKAGSVKPRSSDDLREEERDVVYRRLLTQLEGGVASDEMHVNAELVRAMFDADAMLYFVAEDWWRPRLWFSQQGVDQSYTASLPASSGPQSSTYSLGPADQVGWGGLSDACRPNYEITENSAPAPFGASLGWLLQLDGDPLRNAFLNAPWVKAIVPIRAGREADALAWLEHAAVEGADGLDDPYVSAAGDPPELQNVTVRQALAVLAQQVTAQGSDPAQFLHTETVYENGFDPLAGGFRAPTAPFQVFDQWIEVLPTDQVVAIDYPVTGA